MRLSSTNAGLLVTIFSIGGNACSDSRGDPPAAVDDGHRIGATQEAYCTGHSIVNVLTAPGTYHWEDSAHLLNSAEGFGPRTISINVSSSISPSVSESSTYTPSNSEISSSVGYDLSATFEIDASTSVIVPFGAYARVLAYATFEVTTWNIIGTNCVGAPDVGTGVAYKPVGVYFKTCEALDCSLGGGVVGGGPVPSWPGGGGAGGSGATGSGATGSGGAGGV